MARQQAEAVKVCGCTFFPASEVQVQQLAMQRRIFTLNGMPYVANRDSGFFETHATLARLIESHGRGGVPDTGETVQEATAADAAAEHEIAGERGAGGAQEVQRSRAATRPRPPGRGAKRDR